MNYLRGLQKTPGLDSGTDSQWVGVQTLTDMPKAGKLVGSRFLGRAAPHYLLVLLSIVRI